MSLKQSCHKLKSENTKLKTRVLFLDKEIHKRDKFVEDTLSSTAISFKPKKATLIAKTNLVNSLKRQLHERSDEIRKLKAQLERHQKSKKATTIAELETTVEVLTQECMRLRDLLDQNIKRHDQVGHGIVISNLYV